MIRFASLGSGSKGNATLIEVGSTRLLLDCGFSVKETEKRLLGLSCEPSSLSGILVTHEHGDHLNGVGRLSRKYRLPVWLTVGTYQAGRDTDFAHTFFIDPHESLAIDDIHLQAFPVPHDAREPCQFVFSDGSFRLAVLSDLGQSTPHVMKNLESLDALMLECNYDYDMLMTGAYPYALKQRVAGSLGHLDNLQAEAILKKIDLSKLQHLIGSHISEKNNRREYAQSALCRGADCESDWVSIACQDAGFSWREVV
ncbi:MAG: MBL fold metallo-hydrolase [Proteobacteria bacterium]|nr:MAG: MBL fold metallo-hydrolase [Pseudomonadota bacterium]